MIRILVVFFVLLSSLASAQSVSVRAGEHSDFTRIVLQVPPEMEIVLNPFHGIVGRDVAHVLAPNLSNGYLLTGFPE